MNMVRDISSLDDMIDSRDVIARIEELASDRFQVTYASAGCLPDTDAETFDTLQEAAEHVAEQYAERLDETGRADVLPLWDADVIATWMGTDDPAENSLYAWVIEDTLDDDERAELASLEALAEQCEGYADWEHGEQIIRDSYFQEYAEQLADDIGALEDSDKWPLRHIDWEAAAEELQTDYMCVTFDGTEYWIRSC